jgi:tetratricopeptide (TPR) repeat protein
MMTPARQQPASPGRKPPHPTPGRTLLLLLFCCLLLVPAAGAASVPTELLDEGRADEAIRVLSPQADGSNAQAYNYLCRVYFSLEDWDNAVRNCERAAKLEPRNAMYQLWLGRSFGEKASVSNLILAYPLARKTVAAFANAHELDHHNVAIARDLAEYYTTAPAIVGGSLDKARNLAAEMTSEHPSDAAWIRAMAAASAGHHEEAEHQFAEAIRLDHDSGSSYLDLAHYLLGRKSWERMQQTIEQAMQSPRVQPVDRYNASALLLRTNRNLDEAARLMRAYIQDEHTAEEAPLFRAHFLLGEILLKMGDNGQATAEYRAALSLASSYRPATEALRHLGQPLEARH